ncbi:MAG: PAS domain S-box protein [Salinarimonadaceae bacterium]|nr:MAG: PAS domain S-box protein [Salinarimonadaceae bacterium]
MSNCASNTAAHPAAPLLASAFDLFCVIADDGRITPLGDGWAEALGWSEMDFPADESLELLHPHDRAAAIDTTSGLAPGAKAARFIARCRRKAGDFLWFEWHAARSAVDGPVHAAIRDITEERRNASHAAALEQLADVGNWEIDVETGALDMSPAARRIFGVDAQDHNLTMDKGLALLSGAEAEAMRDALERLIETGEPFDRMISFRNAAGDQRYGRVTGTAERSAGRITRVYGGFQDLTDRRRAEDVARAADTRMQNAIEAMPDGFVLYDDEDRIVAFNEQYRNLHPAFMDLIRSGIRFEDLLRRGLEVGHFADSAGREEEWLAERMRAHRQPKSSIEQPLADGSWIRIVENETADGWRVGLRVDITDLKRQEQRLADIIAGTNVGTWEYDLRTGQIIYNERWAEMIGYTLEELGPGTKDFWGNLAHPEDYARARALLDAHLRGETEFYEVEVRLRHKDGHWVWVLDRGRIAQRAPDGSPLWISGTHLDITSRKEAEFQREESRRRLQATLDAIPDLLFEITEDGVYRNYHSGSDGQLMMSTDNIIGRRIEEVMPPAVAEISMEAVREALASGRSIGKQYELDVLAGARWFELSGVRKQADEDGRPTCILMARDITERRKAQDEVEYQEQLLRGLFALSPVGIALNDFETTEFVDVNATFLAQTGFTRDELLDMTYHDLSSDECRGSISRYFEENPDELLFGPLEEEHFRKDGSRYSVLLRGMRMRDRSGRMLIWSIVEDVSDRKALEATLKAERDFLSQLMATSNSAITALDEKGRIVFANQAAEEVLGIPQATALSQPFDDPAWKITTIEGEPLDPSELPFSRVMATGEPVFDMRHAIVWPDGSRRILSVNAAPVGQSGSGSARVVCSVRDVTQQMEADAKIRMQAREDALTKLANRATLMDELKRFASERRKGDKLGAFLLLDLDYFKEVNDTLGHIAGDKLLMEVAGRLREGVRSGDLVARLGGDEFALILRELRSEEDAEALIEKLMVRLRAPLTVQGRRITPSVSIGAALRREGATDPEELYRNADSALYHAKASGRNTWNFFDAELRERIERRKTVAAILNRSVAANAIEVAYQPQIRLDTGEHWGFEILPYISDDAPLFLTKEHFAIAEEAGQIIALGEQTLERVLSGVSQLLAENLDPGRISLNVFAAQLKDREFALRIAAMLMRYRLSPERLEFEIAENIVLDRSSAAILDTLRACVELGVTVCLDNFGTGAASLSHLTQFPVRSLKIARSFVAAIGSGDDSSRISGTIIDMAHNLGLNAVAEGVETEVQFNALARAGCDFVQGELISPPLLDKESIGAYLASRDILRSKEKVYLL